MAMSPDTLLDDPSTAASLGSAATGLPPFSLTAGPATAEGHNQGTNTAATGTFSFGEAPTGLAAVAQTAVPFLIIGGVLWFAMRK
ncbi:hypothetical protein [Cognatiyoonia sp. IB215182]|uniref:hypothetical protein n=1 Tax=Cognatiyoonia sp. IB215182 TaxID=3097353 RepID=UPI002A128635|nr:hypothetical protein [Cognatiyoonia sp. IB215182]MDX8353665.1 hypothetical protein [Cognatiyoonia sp. IB215182]